MHKWFRLSMVLISIVVTGGRVPSHYLNHFGIIGTLTPRNTIQWNPSATKGQQIGMEPQSRQITNNGAWHIAPWPLTFWHGNGSQHIDKSWTISVPSIKQISQIGTEPQSRKEKNLEWHLWPGPFDLKSYVPQAFDQINVWCNFHENPVSGTW